MMAICSLARVPYDGVKSEGRGGNALALPQ